MKIPVVVIIVVIRLFVSPGLSFISSLWFSVTKGPWVPCHSLSHPLAVSPVRLVCLSLGFLCLSFDFSPAFWLNPVCLLQRYMIVPDSWYQRYSLIRIMHDSLLAIKKQLNRNSFNTITSLINKIWMLSSFIPVLSKDELKDLSLCDEEAISSLGICRLHSQQKSCRRDFPCHGCLFTVSKYAKIKGDWPTNL